MALPITNIERDATSTKRIIYCDVAFDSSYPTGGEALAAATLGLKNISFMHIGGEKGDIF